MRSGDRAGEPKLQGQARMWPTPKTTDERDRSCPSDQERNSPGLSAVIHGHPTQTTSTDGSDTSPKADLNPRFVAALMGVPHGWLTPSTLAETDWSRWQQDMRSVNSSTAST